MEPTETKTEWMPVKGFEGHYEVSNNGRVRSTKKGHTHEMKVKDNRITGYRFVSMQANGVKATRTVHRLVAEAFIPNDENLPQVNHINEDKRDNRVENLEWCTAHYNNEHSKHMRQKRIIVKSADGERLAVFESEKVAAQFLGVGKPAISNALARGTTCGGFVIEREAGA